MTPRLGIISFLVIAVLTVLPVCATAQSCLELYREKIVGSGEKLPPFLLKILGVNQNAFAGLPRTSVSFIRSHESSPHSHLSHQYIVQLNGYKLETTYSLSPARDSSLKSTFNFSVKWKLTGQDGMPLGIYEVETSIAEENDCRPALRSNIVTGYEKLADDQYRINVNRMLGDRNQVSESKVVSAQLIKNEKAISMIDNLLNSKTTLLNRQVQVQTVEPGLPVLNVNVREAPIRLQFDPIARSWQRLSGIQLQSDKLGTRTFVYSSPASDYKLRGYEAADGSQLLEEIVNKVIWQATELKPTRVTGIPEVSGLRAADFKNSQASIVLNGPGRPVELFNLEQYGLITAKAKSAGGWSLRYRSRSLPVPKSVHLSHPVRPEDQKYLQSTKYIQLNEVKELTSAVNSALTSSHSRLDAAVVILNLVQRVIKYDNDSVSYDYVQIRSTKEILQTRLGVCQHFAALFTAVARSLGIPTRIVFGYALGAKATSHAWVEVKIDDETWWPIDAQEAANTLPNRSYIPVGIMEAYELTDDSPPEMLSIIANHMAQIGRHWSEVKISKDETVKPRVASSRTNCDPYLSETQIAVGDQ